MSLSDSVSLQIHCPKHDSVGLRLLDNKPGLYLPLVKIAEEEATEAVVESILKEVCPRQQPFSWASEVSRELIQQTRIELNKEGRHVDHWMFEISIQGNHCCQEIESLVWKPIALLKHEVTSFIFEKNKSLWGLEPGLHGRPHDDLPDLMNELDIPSLAVKLTHKKNAFNPLISAAGYTMDKVIELCQEFFGQAFPSVFLTRVAFADYVSKIGWKSSFGEDQTVFSNRLFSSFLKEPQAQKLSVNEFVVGMACFELSVSHGGNTGNHRLKSIFKYYDTESKGFLSKEDINVMQSHLQQLSKSNTISSVSFPMSPTDLITAVNKKQINGTSGLNRRKFDVLTRRLHVVSNSRETDYKCFSHRVKNCEVADHIVLIDTMTGYPKGVEAIASKIE